MLTFSVPVGIRSNRILAPFPDRTNILNPRFRRTHFVKFSSHRPFLGLTRFGLGQVPVPDSDSTQVLFKDLFERVEGFLYTVADAAVSSSPEIVMDTTAVTKQNSDWLSGITNAMETVLKILKDGLSTVHVPYSYGFAIILLTVIVKAVTFPLTKKQVESAMAMRSLAPQIKAIQEKYAGDQERIQLETARLYKLAGINPLAGCLPTLATIPIWIGLYRALSNVADEGLLSEGFFWIPSLAGPTTIAARQTGGGTSWLFNFVNGNPPLGWSDTFAYLVLPVLLVVSQYISVQIMQPQQSNDPNMKTTQILTKFLPLMIGYFALSVPSGLSLYWLTNNILSTGQQIWLQKLGGAQHPVQKLNNTNLKNDLSQLRKSLSEENASKITAKEEEKLTPKGPRPGERFKLLKEEETRRKKQREEEKRKAIQNVQTSNELDKEDDFVDSNENRNRTDSIDSNKLGSSGSDSFVSNGASSLVEKIQDTMTNEIGNDDHSSKNNHQANGAINKVHRDTRAESAAAAKDMNTDS